MLILKRDVHCPRRMVVYAIFDVLDQLGCQYEQTMVGEIKSMVEVLGHTGEYVFAVTEQSLDTSILHISKCNLANEMTDKEEQLAVRYLMDSVLQHIDEAQS